MGQPPLEAIRLRGVTHNNLRGIDVDIPLGRLTVVTGLSGAGKSSLVFDTLHAEGQRRYVETFSAYTRQFLELLDRPSVASVENVRPSVAIEQTNTVRTSRSTVGTMTELTDYAKVWFARVAVLHDPETGRPVRDWHPEAAWEDLTARHPGADILVTFPLQRADGIPWNDVVQALRAQGYARLLVGTRLGRLEEFNECPKSAEVVQDRLHVSEQVRARGLEALENAQSFGRGEARVHAAAGGLLALYARGLRSSATGRRFRDPTPALFSFNHPLGACPRCRGFGRILEIDWRLAIPDTTKSIEQGAIRAFEGEVYSECRRDLLRWAKDARVRTNVPFRDLNDREKDWIVNGDPSYLPSDDWPTAWYGLKGFFNWLETRTYKMHVRVFLSRFRTAQVCPDCRGARLQPESLCWTWNGRTLPELYSLPVRDLLGVLREHRPIARGPHDQVALAHDAMITRLGYLQEVGLDYLTLDRPARTLSGGEIERVNLTSCLGTSLVETLFVLDEPSVGLHARDVRRLIGVLRRLVDQGNTVVVVEHDPAILRSADHVIEIGPEPGARGGRLVYQGGLSRLLEHQDSVTGAFLSGRRRFEATRRSRRVDAATPRLILADIRRHNVRGAKLEIPLNRLVGLCGVSGSGKSTLLRHALHAGLRAHAGLPAEEPAEIGDVRCDLDLGPPILVDQSPVSRTPRSNPALYCGAWEGIRRLYAETPEARKQGLTAAHFSFNSGDGRCDRCRGLGYELVEMQFLADVRLPCPACGTRRFRPEILAITREGLSIADVLAMTVADAVRHFAHEPSVRIPLEALARVGLGYLTLGQPLPTLSGGESQRLKLVRYLGGAIAGEEDEHNGNTPAVGHALLLLDEPTTGLHLADVERLVDVLQQLVDAGHSVVVVEHNLELLQACDWLIEVGPEAGAGGGRIVAVGTPENIAAGDTSTAPFLQDALRGSLGGTAAIEEERPPAPLVTHLSVVGARENNLRELTVDIPHRALTVVTGVSGSGKSTLAFDIVFAEGQRRFLESMSPYARQFVEQLPRPAVDAVRGIPPTVAIEQRVTRGSRKSTVATITEVAQLLRLLFARVGVQHNPETGRPVVAPTSAELRDLFLRTLSEPAQRNARSLLLCAPVIRRRKGHHQPVADWARNHGYERLRCDGKLVETASFQRLDRFSEHDVEIVVAELARARGTSTQRAAEELLDEALRLGRGSCFLLAEGRRIVRWFSTTRTDPETGESFPELDPKDFSWNSPKGWCPTCRGHGRIYERESAPHQQRDDVPPEIEDLSSLDDGDTPTTSRICPSCNGERLNRLSRAVRVPTTDGGLTLPELLRCRPDELLAKLDTLMLDERGRRVVAEIRPEIEARLAFLREVGLDYLTLDRPTDTLSGGEAQRIRLASQLGSNLTGVLYVLDEPSIGLHARDNQRLIATLERLRDRGNTVLVVEHDDEIMARADHIIDLGPGAGVHGGRLLAAGSYADICRAESSLTGVYLARGIPHPLLGARRPLPPIPRRSTPRATPPAWITLSGVTFRNLRRVTLRIPRGRLTLVSGVSGAGKSTLVRDVLRPAAATAAARRVDVLTGEQFVKDCTEWARIGGGSTRPPFRTLEGCSGIRAVIEVDQAPIGKTPRSTPATYLGAFDIIRDFFAALPESKARGFGPGRFSFNTPGGRCETCAGAGRVKLEMSFLPETYVDCESCCGSRYGPDLADIRWRGKTIADVLALTFEEAAEAFAFHTQLSAMLGLMVETGLGYLKLGQSSPTLSGGEAQRLKLAAELVRGLPHWRERQRGTAVHNLYVLEEPTIGLHLSDCEKLIRLLHRLVDHGHTVIVIEHHLDLLAEADYLVDIGPEAGPNGGRILYQGPPEGLGEVQGSRTAPFLATVRNATLGSTG